MSNAIDPHRRTFTGAVAAVLAAAGFGLSREEAQSRTTRPPELLPTGNLPSLVGATEWLNSAPLTGAGLRGKVVLVNF
jgi:hypothetical protein